jgi:phosphoenolpyruvate synthase/pyruvate phosphate dikinase
VAAVEAAAQHGNSLMIDSACRAVRELVTGTPFPPDMAATLCAAFPLADDGSPGGGRLVVRSSSNVEDLAEMSGAGLYSSVLGVAAGRVVTPRCQIGYMDIHQSVF